MSPFQVKHGMSRTKLYKVWSSMLDRCRNPTHYAYDSYGGRGIKVCRRWYKFENFLKDMGPRPSQKHSLDRIDNNGPYSPKNCRWADSVTQQNNTRTAKKLKCGDLSYSLSQWSRVRNIPRNTIRNRLLRGWSLSRALGYMKLERVGDEKK